MANVLPTSKQSVNLASSGAGVGVSRIRRDPPPTVKEVNTVDVEQREGWAIGIGVVSFALALFVVVLAISSAAGWSPGQYSINIKEPPRAAIKER